MYLSLIKLLFNKAYFQKLLKNLYGRFHQRLLRLTEQIKGIFLLSVNDKQM